MKTRKKNFYRLCGVFSVLLILLMVSCTLKEEDGVYKTYPISTSAGEGGSVSGGDTLWAYNSSVTVLATPDSNYAFLGWYEDTTQVSSTASYIFTVTGARTLVAQFKDVHQYECTVDVVGKDFGLVSGMGLVEGAGLHTVGDTIHLLASASEGHHFLGWYAAPDSSALVSVDSTLDLGCMGDTTLYSMFIVNLDTLTLTSDSDGVVSGAGVYDYGTKVKLIATPHEGYRFAGWYDGQGLHLSDSSTYEFLVRQTSTLAARFTAKPYTITLPPPTAGGTVSGGGDYPYDTTITVEAHAGFGYDFQGWYNHATGGLESPDSVYSFKVTKSDTLEAHFLAKHYTITLASNPVVGGTVLGSGTFPYDSTITVKAFPNAEYSFDGWYPVGGTSSISTNSVYSFKVTKGDTLEAHFLVKQYAITLGSSPTTGGTVLGSGTFPYDSTITVEAHVGFGYDFQGWYNHATGGLESPDSVYSFKVTKGDTLEAHFLAKPYTITLTSSPAAGGRVSGSGTFPYDSTITVEAHVGSGYEFQGWYNHATGGLASTDSTYIFKVSGSASLEARFSNQTYYAIALTQNSTYVSGTVSGAGDFHYGSTITVRSASPAGYVFGSWYDLDSKEYVSRDSVYRFQVLGGRRLQARYAVAISRKHIPSGTFTMGSPTTEDGHLSNETQHEVTLTQDFDMSTYEITWAQYLAYCTATNRQKPTDDGFGQGAHPVTNVSWNAAVAFCAWVGEQTGIACRLPTEAEWEYAARGGNNGQYHTYSGSDIIDDVAWYSKNSMNTTYPVGKKQPNELGIYDMSGNVVEWCSDWYTEASGTYHVLRGGSWGSGVEFCRSASRYGGNPEIAFSNIGFRVVFVP